MITEPEIQRAFDFLRDSATKIADARYHKVYTEERKKAVFSELFRQAPDGPVASKEAYAYAHQDYENHIAEMARAARDFELLRAQREAAIAKIDAWRTASANERGASRAA